MAHLILYDGPCNLCNALNRFVLRRDSARTFQFAPLPAGEDPDTFLVIVDHETPRARTLAKGRAAIFVLGSLPRPWPWVAAALGVLPVRLLDLGYDLIARNRFRLFGRAEDACPVNLRRKP